MKKKSKLKVSNEIFNFVRGFFMQDLIALFDVMCFVHFPFWEYYSSELYMLLYGGCWLDSSWFLASGFSWIWKIDMKMKFGFAFGTTHVAEIQISPLNLWHLAILIYNGSCDWLSKWRLTIVLNIRKIQELHHLV